MRHSPAPSIKWRERLAKKPDRRFFGLEIDRKTNVISLVAFMLSIAGIASQVYFFLQGPRVALQPPEQIVFYGDRSADGKTIYLKLGSRMAYVNTGQPGFNDAIKRETASLSIGPRVINFFWKKYMASDSEGTQYRQNIKGDALPVAINAGSVEAHETSFSPLPIASKTISANTNYIEFDDFATLSSSVSEINVTLSYETFSGQKGSTTCRVIVDESYRYYINNGWIAPICVQ